MENLLRRITKVLSVIALVTLMWDRGAIYARAEHHIIEVVEITADKTDEQKESLTEVAVYAQLQYISDEEVPQADRIDGRSGAIILLFTLSYATYVLIRIKRNQLAIFKFSNDKELPSASLIRQGRTSMIITALFLVSLAVLCFFWASRADLVLTFAGLALTLVCTPVLVLQRNKFLNMF